MLRKSYTLPGGIQSRDLFAGVVVFFIALPLCLGVAMSLMAYVLVAGTRQKS